MYGHSQLITLWEMAMETSYTVDFEAEQVRGLIRELTQTDEYGRAGDEFPLFPARCAPLR